MLNIAVIGAGKLGEFHIKLLKTSTKFNLVGFHEKNKERLNEISSKYEIKIIILKPYRIKLIV